MSEENKKLIQRMFDAQLANDMTTYRTILADDLSWQIMQFGIDQLHTKEEMIKMIGGVHDSLGGGEWKKKATSMVAEGDTVAVEAVATMELRNGNLYHQRYHYVYRIRNGQVYEVREYMDSLAASKAFEGLPAVAEPAE